MHITLRQLQLFVTIAQHSSLTKAAEQLHLSRSAASMALAELESQFNQPLFDRNKQRLIINRFGEKLLPYADELLRRYRDIQSLTNLKQRLTGQLRIGVSNTIGNYLLPRLLANFRHQTQHLHQTITMGNSNNIFDALDHFRVDIGLVEQIPDRSHLHWEVWRQDHLSVAAAPNHPLAQKKRVSLDALSKNVWVVREAGSGMRHLFEQRIRSVLTACDVALELNSSECLVQSVMAGIGIGYLSQLSIADRVANQQLATLNTDIASQRDLYLVWHQDKHLDPLLSKFIEHCRQFEPQQR